MMNAQINYLLIPRNFLGAMCRALVVVCFVTIPAVCMAQGEVVTTYRAAAEQGDAEAQYNLGMAYRNGEGVPQDFEEAVRWFRAAAEQGDARAQYSLGVRYFSGEGVPQDYEQAVRWFYSAAEQDHTSAQYNLGRIYWTGKGVPRDVQESVQWLRLAAEKGHARAQYYLGRAYLDGEGVNADSFVAWEWFSAAGIQGHAGALEALQRLPTPQLPARAFDIESGTVWVQGGVIFGPQDQVMLVMDLQNKTQRRIWAEVEFQLPETGEFVQAFEKVKGEDTTRYGWPIDSIAWNTEYPFRISVFDDRKRRTPIGTEESFYYFDEDEREWVEAGLQALRGEQVVLVVGFRELTLDGLTAEVPGSLAERGLRRDIVLSLFSEESKLHKECEHTALKAEQYGENDRSLITAEMGKEAQELEGRLRPRGDMFVEKWYVESCNMVSTYEVLLTRSPEGGTDIMVKKIVEAVKN